MAFLSICRYADIGVCRYADIADIFIILLKQAVEQRGSPQGTLIIRCVMAQNADIQISALKMFADTRYADIEKSADMPILPMPI